MRSTANLRTVLRVVHLAAWERTAGGLASPTTDRTAELDRLATTLATIEELELAELPADIQPLRLFRVPPDDLNDAEDSAGSHTGAASPAARQMSALSRCPASIPPADRQRIALPPGDADVGLPHMRVQFAKSRRAGNQPISPAAQLEANLEQLMTQLEAEIDKLEGASQRAVRQIQGLAPDARK